MHVNHVGIGGYIFEKVRLKGLARLDWQRGTFTHDLPPDAIVDYMEPLIGLVTGIHHSGCKANGAASIQLRSYFYNAALTRPCGCA